MTLSSKHIPDIIKLNDMYRFYLGNSNQNFTDVVYLKIGDIHSLQFIESRFKYSEIGSDYYGTSIYLKLRYTPRIVYEELTEDTLLRLLLEWPEYNPSYQ